jgi:xylan 1,4-beta-xylosidase
MVMLQDTFTAFLNWVYNMLLRLLSLAGLLLYGMAIELCAQGITDSLPFYNQVKTYTNPVLPGDHPDPTLLKVGDDFYHCGSSFHFTPYLPIYHSKDLVHWKVIGRVLAPEQSGFVTDRPSAGIWQGAITYFYGSYWIYFSANGQWFSKASSPAGPWSKPEQVKTNPRTGPLGYDNSIFIDGGKPYMVIKNGQKTNRLQALGHDGQLADTVINLDWVNANLQYSWAEGPVMCKRNGFYYYFPAGDVSGGQYAMRGTELSADSAKWERLGEFFKPITDPKVGFRRPNHISAPFELADGTWWTIGQSYEKYNNDDWSGMGRQTSLYQVIWEGDRPWGVAPTTAPLLAPILSNTGIPWRSVISDYFERQELLPYWHFLTKKAASRYSLTGRKGWLRLTPDSIAAHLLQKETDHYYSAITKLEFNPTDTSHKAGIYLTNGNQTVFAKIYSGFYKGEAQVVFQHDSIKLAVPNSFGKSLFLKLERNQHMLTAFASSDGRSWTLVGNINSWKLDRAQPNFNSWVGTSIGLFAEANQADFDRFVYRDGHSELPAVGYSNYFGIEKLTKDGKESVTNSSGNGGWLMISGVDFGEKSNPSKKLSLLLTSNSSMPVEIYIDGLGSAGKLLTKIMVKKTGLNAKEFKGKIPAIEGQHDVFIKLAPASPRSIELYSLKL